MAIWLEKQSTRGIGNKCERIACFVQEMHNSTAPSISKPIVASFSQNSTSPIAQKLTTNQPKYCHNGTLYAPWKSAHKVAAGSCLFVWMERKKKNTCTTETTRKMLALARMLKHSVDISLTVAWGFEYKNISLRSFVLIVHWKCSGDTPKIHEAAV